MKRSPPIGSRIFALIQQFNSHRFFLPKAYTKTNHIVIRTPTTQVRHQGRHLTNKLYVRWIVTQAEADLNTLKIFVQNCCLNHYCTLRVIHGCLKASLGPIRFAGSTSNIRSTKLRPSTDTERNENKYK